MKPVAKLRLHALNFAGLRNDWFCVCSFFFFANQPNLFFGNVIIRIGTVWVLPACQIIDLEMFYLAVSIYFAFREIKNSELNNVAVCVFVLLRGVRPRGPDAAIAASVTQ